MPSDQFVPSSEVAKLVANSYEALHTRLAEAVQSERARIFGHVDQAVLLGTFPSHAVVCSSDGRFAEVKYESTNTGSLKLLEHKILKVPTYTKDNLDSFVYDQAKAAVAGFLSGDKAGLTQRLSEMATLVGEKPKISEDEIANRLTMVIKEDRPWKKLFNEKRLEIKSNVIDHITPLENARLSKKFERLYNGSTASDKLENFRDLVNEDFKYLTDRLIALTDLVSIALESVDCVKAGVTAESKDVAFTAFKDFSESLLSSFFN